MNIQYISLHYIEQESNFIQAIDLEQFIDRIEPLARSIFTEILESKNKRSFKLPEYDITLVTEFRKILRGNEDQKKQATFNISKKLLDKEILAQEQIKAIAKIPKGSVFLIIIEHEHELYLVINKTDLDRFTDEVDFEIKRGIPENKKTYKAFLAKIVNEQLIQLYVFDSSKRLASYWWSDFLDLNPIHEDAHNTEKVLGHLVDNIIAPIKKISKEDHRILRNATIGYFRSNESFDLESYKSSVIDNYIPENENVDIKKCSRRIERMYSIDKFDTTFNIVPDKINKKASYTVDLTPKLTLLVKDHLTSIEESKIQAFQEDGRKWIKIETEEGYNQFNK